MKKAYEMWAAQGKRDRMCCGGISPDSTHFYFHGKYWEGTHGVRTKKGAIRKNGPSVSVECGASFYNDGATTYFLRDFDSYCDSEEYGEKIPYSTPDFWNKLMLQVNKGAEAAWNSDILSCNKCGYHTFEGSCGCQ